MSGAVLSAGDMAEGRTKPCSHRVYIQNGETGNKISEVGEFTGEK